jgi:cytochrome d ubiquinol oxidase subunit II
MLGALILRVDAFVFRGRGRTRAIKGWTIAFAGGSAVAAVAQGLVLGGFIQGFRVEAGAFAGGAFDWLTPYTVLVALGVVAGYALLGAGWIIWKTQTELHGDARRWAWIATPVVAALLLAVSIATIFVHPQIAARWGIEGGIDWARFAPLSVIPALGAAGLAMTVIGLARKSHRLPFLGGVLTFLSGYLGLAVGFFPYVAPYALTYEQAASAPNALALMLVGVAILLPVILGYMVWVYWIFRGKVADGAAYH